MLFMSQIITLFHLNIPYVFEVSVNWCQVNKLTIHTSLLGALFIQFRPMVWVTCEYEKTPWYYVSPRRGQYMVKFLWFHFTLTQPMWYLRMK
ncbi:hypothetical protein GR7B_00069 [Vibrio phage vB_VcorM_GR7B]|nr:hypothetical protein GR7B_00069 [Vibrio phage vB_VcorM_GR7B]